MYRKVRALRPLLTLLRAVALGLVALDIALLLLRFWPGVLGAEQMAAGRVFSALVSVSLLAMLLLLIRRLDATLADAERVASQQQHLLDALSAGIVLFDAEGRIVLTNDDFRRTYAALGDAIQPGSSFERLLSAAIAHGLVPDVGGDDAAWIAQRRAEFGRGTAILKRRTPDGRWRQIIEQRLADGRVLSHGVDITELVAKEDAIEAALEDAELARQRLAGAIEALPACFELYDADDRLVLWNQRLAEVYPQMAQKLVVGARFEDLARANLAGGGQPEYRDRPDEWVAKRQAERRTGGMAPTLMNNGHGRWLRMYEKRLPDGSIVAIRIDVTELEQQRRDVERAQRDAEQARQRLEDAIEALPAGFELYDAEDRLVMTNQTMLEMYPLVGEQARTGLTFEQLVRINAAKGGLPQFKTAAELDAWIAMRMQERKAPAASRVHQLLDESWVRTYERRTRDGGLVTIRLDVSELMRRDAELTALNAKLESLNQELATLSRTDPLTGLANRRAFDQRLGEEVSRAARHGMPLALLIVDVDHFKRYNDLYGHPAGDQCLRRVAELLRSHAGRATDLACRLGGEEFALLLPHQASRDATALAERCLAALDALAIEHAASPGAAHVTVSIGVADLRSCGGADPETLFRAADRALYAAKQQGRRRVVAYAAE